MFPSTKTVEVDIATCLKCNSFHGHLDVVSDHQETCNDFTPAYMKAIDDLSKRFFKDFRFQDLSANGRFELQIHLLSETRKKTTWKDFLKTMFIMYNRLASTSLETLAKVDPEVLPSQMEREPRGEEIIPESMATKKGKKKKPRHKKGKKSKVTDEIVEESLEKESVASQSKVIDEKVFVSEFSKNGKQKIKMVQMGKSPRLPLKRYMYMCLDGGEPSDDKQNNQQIVDRGEPSGVTVLSEGNVHYLTEDGNVCDMSLDGGEPSDDKQKMQQIVDGGEPRGVTVTGEGNVQYLTEDGNVCGFEDLNLAKFDEVEERVHYLTEDGTQCAAFEDLELVKFDEVSVRLDDAVAVVDSWRDTGDLLNFDSYKRTGEEFEPQFDPAILLVSQVPPSVGEEGEIILWKSTK